MPKGSVSSRSVGKEHAGQVSCPSFAHFHLLLFSFSLYAGHYIR